MDMGTPEGILKRKGASFVLHTWVCAVDSARKMAKSARDMWSHCSSKSSSFQNLRKVAYLQKFGTPHRFLKMTRCSPLHLHDFLQRDREGHFLSGHAYGGAAPKNRTDKIMKCLCMYVGTSENANDGLACSTNL